MDGNINEWLLAMKSIGLAQDLSSSSAAAVNAPPPNSSEENSFDFNTFLQNNLRKIIVNDIIQPELVDGDDWDENISETFLGSWFSFNALI